MKLQAKLTLLVNADNTTLEITDASSRTRFVRILLTPEQLSAALGRQSMIDCEMEVIGLDQVGKTHEHKFVFFEIPENLASSKYAAELNGFLQTQLKDGWVACDSYVSKGSFYKENGVQYARATIRRYV